MRLSDSFSRRDFCRAALLAASGLMTSAAGCDRLPFIKGLFKDRPNILLVTADDLGLQAGCYGDHLAHTPHLDRIAASGVCFTNAYTTCSSCSPSRASIFTGLYPHQSGQVGLAHYGYAMDHHYPMLPELLNNAGYRTGVIGKIHVAPAPEFEFQIYADDPLKTRNVRNVAKIADQFVQESAGQPFFLMVNYLDPHPEFVDQIDGLPQKIARPEQMKPLPFIPVDTPLVRKRLAGYYNSIARFDAGLGKLMAVLEARGVASDTLVMVLGDNGPPFTRAKATCYEAGLRVPLVASWTRMTTAPSTNANLVSVVDLFATILAAAGVDPPPGTGGMSLLDFICAKPHAAWRHTLYGEYITHTTEGHFPRRSIRDERYKLIVNLKAGQVAPYAADTLETQSALTVAGAATPQVREAVKRFVRPPALELYDLEKDPWEFVNLAEEPGMRTIRDRLWQDLATWQQATHDTRDSILEIRN